MTHDELKVKYASCTLCGNCQNGKKVFGSGNLSAKIAVVGEGPGREEAAQLAPFVGPAGQLLEKILLGIGLKRSDVFLTNAVLCRTDDKNRTPTRQESLNCRLRLFEELAIVKPRYTILAGGTPLRAIFGEDYKISEHHGAWLTMLDEPCFFFFPIYHPAWILHSVSEGEEKAKKKTMWDDIRKFKTDVESLDSWWTQQGDTIETK